MIDEAPAAQREQAKPIRDAVQRHDPRQVGAAYAPARIEAVAHGRPREQRKADAVADCVADEGGQGDARAGDAPADVDESQLVIAAQYQVVGRAAQQGQQQVVGAEVGERGLEVAIADRLQFVMQDP